jgi:hypothetical protein
LGGREGGQKVLGQPGLGSETLAPNKTKQTNKKSEVCISDFYIGYMLK